jgi:transposase
MSVSKIAEMVGMSRAQTYRLVKKIKAEGGDNDGE